MSQEDAELFLEHLQEKRDYFLNILKQIQIEKMQELTNDEKDRLLKFEKEMEIQLNNSNKRISQFIKEQKLGVS